MALNYFYCIRRENLADLNVNLTFSIQKMEHHDIIFSRNTRFPTIQAHRLTGEKCAWGVDFYFSGEPNHPPTPHIFLHEKITTGHQPFFPSQPVPQRVYTYFMFLGFNCLLQIQVLRTQYFRIRFLQLSGYFSVQSGTQTNIQRVYKCTMDICLLAKSAFSKMKLWQQSSQTARVSPN